MYPQTYLALRPLSTPSNSGDNGLETDDASTVVQRTDRMTAATESEVNALQKNYLN